MSNIDLITRIGQWLLAVAATGFRCWYCNLRCWRNAVGPGAVCE